MARRSRKLVAVNLCLVCYCHQPRVTCGFLSFSTTLHTSISSSRYVGPSSPPLHLSESSAVETSTEIPEPLTPLERVARAANFWVRVVPALAGYGGLIAELQFRNQILGPEWCLSDEDCEVRWDEVHEKSATALAEACNDLQGFYAKTGQIIATRSDLFPEQYTDRLAFLTDSTDPMDPAVVRRIVANQLCGGAAELSSVFSEWDDEPLGSATVAQVHRARLVPELGGGEVAVGQPQGVGEGTGRRAVSA